MAAVDKIYGTNKQYVLFRKWCEENNPELCKYFYYPPSEDEMDDKRDRPITNFPEWADKWLKENCPIDFVLRRLEEQYPQWFKQENIRKKGYTGR